MTALTTAEKATRQAALTRLAIATRERLPEEKADRDAFFRIYLDDFDAFSTDTFVRACRRLETKLDWFPKKHELYDACQAIAEQKRAAQKPQLALPPGVKPIDPERFRNFKQDVELRVRERHDMNRQGSR